MSDFVPVRKVEDEDFTPVRKVNPESSSSTGESIVKNVVRPTLEYGGLAAGSIVGAGAGLPTGPGAVLSGVAGGALGYGIGKQAANFLEEALGYKTSPDLPERMVEAGTDVAEGAAMEMGGQAIGKGLSVVGKGAEQLLGRLTGTGTAAVEQAVLGSPSFKDALRGKISPQAIVDHAKDALTILKNNRGQAYRKQLAEVAKNRAEVDTMPITDELKRLMGQYNVLMKTDGTIDVSRIKMGKSGRNDISEIIDLVGGWGKRPGDRSVSGLDVLKGQLDDFYSDSSQARQFVTSLKSVVHRTISAAEPRYKEMTKAYAEATGLIKDIESNLMLRKQGMSGRIVADQTLRRLTSAMKDDFTLRRELVEALGNQSTKDLMGEVAGQAMSSWTPRGISGSGLALTNAAIAYTVNPKLWPVLAASSPRVVGEFLNIYGKGLQAAQSPLRRASERFISFKALDSENDEPIRQPTMR